jgi:hypothetical protein
MAWQTEMVEILRALVNDLPSTTYTDLTLQRMLAVAALQVTQELANRFLLKYAGRPDPTAPNITPDPTDVNTGRDESFINLCCLKAACITDHGAAIVAARQGIMVKDGSSSIDLRGIAISKLKLLESGWCAVYEDTKLEFITGSSGNVAGAAIMTPFRLFADGSFYGQNAWDSERGRNVYGLF